MPLQVPYRLTFLSNVSVRNRVTCGVQAEVGLPPHDDKGRVTISWRTAAISGATANDSALLLHFALPHHQVKIVGTQCAIQCLISTVNSGKLSCTVHGVLYWVWLTGLSDIVVKNRPYVVGIHRRSCVISFMQTFMTINFIYRGWHV